MDELTNKVALVTGSSRGIGRSIALELARAGANLVVHYCTRQDDAAEVRAAIHLMGRGCTVVQADMARPDEVGRLAREAGPVDILVNNAGIAKPQPFEQLTEADWDEVVDTNLKSCFLLTQAMVGGMRARRWGRIINLSSVAAQVGGIVGPHYAASKAGMHGLTHFYASRLAKEGVTVNAIAPALIETEMVTSNPNATPDRIPAGRFGVPDEVAAVALMLARNGYITGQTINVNGGWYMS
jgi:3-oxoacyl-[acyl-carrier protein] reductase